MPRPLRPTVVPTIPIFQRSAGGKWYLRRTIPRDLQRHFEQKNGRRRTELSALNLETYDRRHALAVGARAFAEHQAMLAGLKSHGSSAEDASAYFRGKIQTELLGDSHSQLQRRNAARRQLLESIGAAEAKLAAERHTYSPAVRSFQELKLELRRRELAKSDLLPFQIKEDLQASLETISHPEATVPEEEALAFLLETRPGFDPEAPEGAAQVHKLASVFQAVAEATLGEAILRFNPLAPDLSPAAAGPPSPNRTDRTPNATLRNYHVTEFRLNKPLKQKKGQPGVMPATFEKCAEGVRYFTDIMGDLSLGDITPDHLIEFSDIYARVPVGWMKRSEYRGKPLRELVSIADEVDPGVRRLAPETVNSALTGLRSVFKHAVKQRHLKANPAAGVVRETARDKSCYPAFTAAELNSLFRAPIFAGCASNDDERSPGTHLVRDHRFWAHFCLLFTGARVSEMGGIRTDQVHLLDDGLDGYFEFDWTEGAEGRAIKNRSSVRIVPIHKELIRLGFPAYARSIRAAGHDRLFPGWKPNTRNCDVGITKNEYSSSPRIKRFYAYPEMKAIKRPGLSLKSYRATFETATLGTSFNERTLLKLTGRAQKAESLESYLPSKVDWQQLKAVADAIVVDGLDLSHLAPFRD
jgi:hypothetical protein